MRSNARTAVVVALTLLLGSCSHPRYYDAAEQALATSGRFASQGHFAVYYPSEIALAFPGYVVGIELSDRELQLRQGDLVVDIPKDAGSTTERLAGELQRGQPPADHPGTVNVWGLGQVPLISHIVRYEGAPRGRGNCALYSLYQSPEPELMEFCGGVRRPPMGDPAAYSSAFADSWTAVDLLKQALRSEAESGRYTHLIVAMMGWRTTQEEAIRNFNSLMGAIQSAATSEFRPLFLGITWVAQWGGRWVDPITEIIAYGEVAELADTLGLTWLGVIAEEAVLPLSGKLPTSVVTHSFGARAAITALCIGPVIRRSPSTPHVPAQGAVDRVFGLQAALSLQRLKEGRFAFFYEHVNLPHRCEHARSIVLTTSKYDTATRTILWADLAGNYRYYQSFCKANSETLVSCAPVNRDGEIVGSYDASKKVLYLDASELVRYTAPGSDGGSHSDIFRAGMGRLIWSLISSDARGAR